MESLQESFQQVLKERKLNVRKVADLTGVGRNILSNIKNGTGPDPNKKTLQKIADGLNLKLTIKFEEKG